MIYNLWQDDAGQAGTIVKKIIRQILHFFRDPDTGKTGTSTESIIFNVIHIFWKIDLSQAGAVFKSTLPDHRKTGGQGDLL